METSRRYEDLDKLFSLVSTWLIDYYTVLYTEQYTTLGDDEMYNFHDDDTESFDEIDEYDGDLDQDAYDSQYDDVIVGDNNSERRNEQLLLELEPYVLIDHTYILDKIYEEITGFAKDKRKLTLDRIKKILESDIDIFYDYEIFGEEFILNLMKLQMNMFFSFIKQVIYVYPKKHKKTKKPIPMRPRPWIPSSIPAPNVLTANSFNTHAISSTTDRQRMLESSKIGSREIRYQMNELSAGINLIQIEENEIIRKIIDNLSEMKKITDSYKKIKQTSLKKIQKLYNLLVDEGATKERKITKYIINLTNEVIRKKKLNKSSLFIAIRAVETTPSDQDKVISDYNQLLDKLTRNKEMLIELHRHQFTFINKLKSLRQR